MMNVMLLRDSFLLHSKGQDIMTEGSLGQKNGARLLYLKDTDSDLSLTSAGLIYTMNIMIMITI